MSDETKTVNTTAPPSGNGDSPSAKSGDRPAITDWKDLPTGPQIVSWNDVELSSDEHDYLNQAAQAAPGTAYKNAYRNERNKETREVPLKREEREEHRPREAGGSSPEQEKQGQQDKPEYANAEFRPMADNSVSVAAVTEDVSPEATAFRRELRKEIDAKYVLKDGSYRDRDYPLMPLIHDHGDRLTTDRNRKEVADAMVKIGLSRGWDQMMIAGNERFYDHAERHIATQDDHLSMIKGGEKTVENAKPGVSENQATVQQGEKRKSYENESVENDEIKKQRALAEQKEELRRLALRDKLEKDYRVADNKFYFKDKDAQSSAVLAFRVKDDTIKTRFNSERVTASIVDYAESVGASSIEVKGHKDFRRQVWREGTIRGIAVDGYEPTKSEREYVERTQAALSLGREAVKERVHGEENQALITKKIEEHIEKRQFDLPDVRNDRQQQKPKQQHEEMQL